MRRTPIERQITETLVGLCREAGTLNPDVRLEIPRQKGFGDLASNVAMTAAATVGMTPRALAERLASNFPTTPDGVEYVEIAGPGFLNFHLAPGYFHNLLREVLADPEVFGDLGEGAGEKWLFEFVSANPTGPLNIVSARAASIGDALVRIFRKRGFAADSEFYVNDGGKQVNLLGASVRARLAELAGNDAEASIPEGGYFGGYVADIGRTWRAAHPTETPPTDEALGVWAADEVLRQQKTTLAQFRVGFDRWFRESEVYAAGGPAAAVRQLTGRGVTFEKDGALYFRATDFGDAEDRVLVTSEGRFTYRVPDIAYHLDKFGRGYKRAVDLLGPDHHGHIVSMTAALKALGLPGEFFHATIVQQVNLKRGGEPVKMSKRAGVGVSLDELLGEVGVDAARFFFLRRKISTPLDFDIELARRHSDENPVYYVQYAHARIRSILRQPGAMKVEKWKSGKVEKSDSDDYGLLSSGEELDLLRALALFPWTLSAIVRGIEPHQMTVYLIDLARTFHLFYQRHRVISDDRDMTAARLDLCRGVAGVLKEGLGLIGVEAPERM